MALDLMFLDKLCTGKAYDDWFPLLHPVLPTAVIGRDPNRAVNNTYHEDEDCIRNFNVEVTDFTEEILETLSRPHYCKFDGQDSRPFKMWFSASKNWVTLDGERVTETYKFLRECGYMVWDSEIPLSE